MESLERSGGPAGLAVTNAQEIIKKLQLGEMDDSSSKEKQTRHGENRIRNCVKFNLANGYRLITIKDHETIRLVFMGNHDECDRWLEKNRGLEIAPDENEIDFPPDIITNETLTPAAQNPDPVPPEDDYETELLTRVNDSILRQIFFNPAGTNKQKSSGKRSSLVPNHDRDEKISKHQIN